MWALLSDPGHSNGFADDGTEYAPMTALLVDLSNRQYAEQLYGVRSLYSFGITTAARYTEKDGHDFVRIQYNPATGLFHVAYDEWIAVTRNPPHRTACTLESEANEARCIIDNYVQRLMLSTNRYAEPADAREQRSRAD